jgi:hypothetical protein
MSTTVKLIFDNFGFRSIDQKLTFFYQSYRDTLCY